MQHVCIVLLYLYLFLCDCLAKFEYCANIKQRFIKHIQLIYSSEFFANMKKITVVCNVQEQFLLLKFIILTTIIIYIVYVILFVCLFFYLHLGVEVGEIGRIYVFISTFNNVTVQCWWRKPEYQRVLTTCALIEEAHGWNIQTMQQFMPNHLTYLCIGMSALITVLLCFNVIIIIIHIGIFL